MLSIFFHSDIWEFEVELKLVIGVVGLLKGRSNSSLLILEDTLLIIFLFICPLFAFINSVIFVFPFHLLRVPKSTSINVLNNSPFRVELQISSVVVLKEHPLKKIKRVHRPIPAMRKLKLSVQGGLSEDRRPPYARSPRILRASWISLGMMVTRLAWIAHKLLSSKRPTR